MKFNSGPHCQFGQGARMFVRSSALTLDPTIVDHCRRRRSQGPKIKQLASAYSLVSAQSGMYVHLEL